MKKTIALLVLILAPLAPAAAQLPALESRPAVSASEQFLVFPPGSSIPSKFSNVKTTIPLDPALLVISAERIKESLWRKLDVKGSWQGRILVRTHPARFATEPPSVVIEPALRGWSYHVDLPDSMEQSGFVTTMVHVLLLEIANRNADSHPAEMPLWLAEGLSQELLDADSATLILPTPQDAENGLNVRRVNFEGHRPNAVKRAKEILNARPPLTFEELSWPNESELSGETGAIFRCSAQMFVEQLLQLQNGQACMRAMLEDLPRRYNWQFALLNGYQDYFHSLLDVEKWWSLRLVEFTGRDPLQFWTPEESWKRLDEIVRSPVQVRSRPGELPMRTEVSFQAIIQEWDAVQQSALFQRKLQDLTLLRFRVAPDFLPLVDAYRQVIENYLQKQKHSGSIFSLRRQRAQVSDSVMEEALHELNALDEKRESLRPVPPKSAAATAQAR
jgi:hypothetical protein